MEMPSFDGWTHEEVISYCQGLMGITPQQAELNRQNCEARKKRHAEICEESYKKGYPGYYKKRCPVCGTVFYTDNPRRIYDNGYVCASKRQCQRKARKRSRMRRGMICQHCGKEFKPSRSDAKYCSAACRQAAYRQRASAQNEHMPQP